MDVNDANNKFVNFKGIEIDVFFEIEKNVFDVRHHGKYRGNTLLDFLRNINDKELFIWIDLKNLNNKNVLAIRDRLSVIIDSGVNKEHLLIESKNIELLEVLQNEGFDVKLLVTRNFNLIKSTCEVNQMGPNMHW